MNKVVVTGPESSGKSTLCASLSSHYNISFVKEYARVYLKDKTTYDVSDLVHIARGQLNLENALSSNQPRVLLCDTDLLTIKIWSDFKFGKVDDEIDKLLKSNLPNLYLLCKPDIPWEFDELRENPGDRDELFEIYLNNIRSLGVPYKIIEGDKEKRVNDAIQFVKFYSDR